MAGRKPRRDPRHLCKRSPHRGLSKVHQRHGHTRGRHVTRQINSQRISATHPLAAQVE